MVSIEERVKVIPVEQPFLRILAEHVHERSTASAPDFSNNLMVFPSQRNKFYFRRYLLEASGLKSIMPPVMKTLDELIEYCYGCLGGRRAKLLHGIERNFLLKDVTAKLKVEFWGELTFLKFINIGNRLLNFFDELAQERVTFDRIEEEVQLGHYPEKYVKNELPILKKIWEEYRATLKAHGYQDAVDVNGLVFEQFNSECLKDFENIFICGLAATTVVETALVKKILAERPSELILHSCMPDDLQKMENPEKPFYIHNKLLRGLGIDISQIHAVRGKQVSEPVVHVKEVKTEAEQTFYMQSVLRKCIEDQKELHRIGIVLSDEAITYSVTETLRAAGVEYNLSAGLPFARSVLYSFLGQLHDAIRSDLHHEEFFTFVRHPLFKNAVVDSRFLRPLIYALQDFMVENRINFLKPSNIPDDRFEPLIGIVKRGLAVVQNEIDLAVYIEGIVNYLNDLLGYNKQLLETDAPDIKEFFEQLHRIADLRLAEKMTARGIDMLEFILRVLKEQRFRVTGDPMRGIQVIGLLEARNLDFDCLILPSMNEGVFPRRSEKDMFINQEVRRAVGLPYTQERENLYYYYFTELNKGKREVFLSYVAEQERDVASRFISLAASSARKDESVIKLAPAAFNVRKRSVKKSPQLVKALYQYVQREGLSPTALSDYRKCPYRYYLRYVLRISEPDKIIEEPGAMEWGEVVHKALRNFYQYHFPRGFIDKEMDQAANIIEHELEKALQNNRSLALQPKAVTYLDLNVYKRRLRHFLDNETERFRAGFKIFKAVLERKTKHHVQVNGAQVCVYGYIDRIDLFENQYYIIDYKTGRIPHRKDFELGEDFSEFQLPLYALVFSREHYEMIGGMLYYEIGRTSRTVNMIEGNDASAYLNVFKNDILVPTIKELLDPEITFYQTDDDDSCEYCTYAQICGDEHGR